VGGGAVTWTVAKEDGRDRSKNVFARVMGTFDLDASKTKLAIWTSDAMFSANHRAETGGTWRNGEEEN
jgi:hypothetical protein